MPETTVALRYIGAEERYFEIAATGQQQGWRRHQINRVVVSESAALLATGLFERVPEAVSGVAAPVTISGSPGVGNTLTATVDSEYSGTPAYQWLRGLDGASTLTGAVAIAGATSSTYLQVSGDQGRLLGCRVSGLIAPAASASGAVPVAPVVGVAPSIITAPVVTSTPTVGQTVAAQTYTVGTYSGTPAPSTALDSWLLDGSVVSTGYTLAAGDAGKGLQVRLNVSNASGTIYPTATAVAVQAASATPSTRSYTFGEVQGGVLGPRDTTSNALRMAAGSAWRTVWAGKITGTTAKIRMNQGGSPAGTIRVVVNGGAETVCPNVGDLFTLFDALPQAEHDVIMRISDGAGIFGYWVRDWTDALQVTGAPPSVYTYPVAVDSIAGNPLAAVATVGSTSVTGQATYLGANWSPTTTSRAVGNSSNSWRVGTAATEMCVYTRSRYVYYCIDGGAPIRVDSGAASGNTRSVRIALSGTRTYNVWTDRFANSFGQPATLCLNGPLIDIGATKGRDFQWGTSLTAADLPSANGKTLTSTGECDVYGVAAALGRTGQQLGRSGSTLAITRANIDADLVGITNVTSADRAIVEMGRNDATPPLGGALSTQRQADYNYIVDALLAKGFGRVYLRAMIPEGSNSWADYNSSLSALVSSRADARVRYLDASAWVVTGYVDGVHYDDIGYAQIRAQAIAWFQGNP